MNEVHTALLARVLLLTDGSIHIALVSKQTYACTVGAFKHFISDPFGFYHSDLSKFTCTTEYTNPKKLSLEVIPGLTLLSAGQDNKTICFFPELFQCFFNLQRIGRNDSLMDFKDILSATHLFDQKQFLLKLYLKLSQNIEREWNLDRRLNLKGLEQSYIIQEIANTIFSVSMPADFSIKIEDKDIDEPLSVFSTAQQEIVTDAGVPGHYIPLLTYALKHNFNRTTAYSWVQKNRLKSAIRDNNGKWWVDPNDVIIDGRKNRIGGKYITLKSKSYEDVQVWIEQRQLFTDKVRPFIRTYEEAKYYELNNYHEVEWDGFSFLICNVNPDYFCISKQKTNREIMYEGNAPLVPNNEDYKFHLHHIGQRNDSPLAILPENVHNGTNTYSVFHEGNDSHILRGPQFEFRRTWFWKKYIEMWDIYRGFANIPFLNSKHKKKKKIVTEE